MTDHPQRIRKVKCDEGRPSCDRCVSTGRACDGYGIWGGGASSCNDGHVIARSCSAKTLSASQELPVLAVNVSERLYLDWFLCRTALKIPGPFKQEFWQSTVMQASHTEPVVMNALLTLSAVHRRDACDGYGGDGIIIDEQEQFMLHHYMNATTRLRTLIRHSCTFSTRVALISCLLFSSIELLRGCFSTAQAHLESGSQLIKTYLFKPQIHQATRSITSQDRSDRVMLDAFARATLHVELFHSTHPRPLHSLVHWPSITSHDTFDLNTRAWHRLERLIHNCLCQQRITRHGSVLNPDEPSTDEQRTQTRQTLQAGLAEWADHFINSEHHTSMEDYKEIADQSFVMHYFGAWHDLAIIMAGSCTDEGGSSRYDAYSDRFSSIVTHCAAMHDARLAQREVQALPGRLMNMSRSLVDMGWLPPLYFTALRCRVRDVRLRSIELMVSNSHREGIWDSKICARVGRAFLENADSVRYFKVELTDHVADGFRVMFQHYGECQWEEVWLMI